MRGVSDSETPAAEPGAAQASAGDEPTAEESAGQPAPRRGLGSVRSMIISMVLVVLAVVAWWAWVPRADQTQQRVEDVAGIAREVGLSKHWDPAVASGLPKGWQPVNVRLVPADKQPDTWQAGYDAPGGSYARVVQTKDGSPSWVQAQTDDSRAAGSVTIDGVRWDKLDRADGGERSLVRSEPLEGLTTVVTGTGDWSQVQKFAASLKPLSKSDFKSVGPTAPAGS